MILDLLPAFIRENYEVHEWKHASAILHNDFPNEWEDITAVLVAFRLRKSWITIGGGSKSKVAEALDSEFFSRGMGREGFLHANCGGRD